MNQIARREETQVATTREDPAGSVIAELKKPAMMNALAKALPRHLPADRFLRVAMTALRSNSDLAKAHHGSFIGSLLQMAQLGLEVNTPLGHAFLIPFWSSKQGIHVVTPIIGYKGILELAHRSGQLAAVGARVAREGDEFTYVDGFEPDFRFVRRAEPTAKLTHAWCFGTTVHGGRFLEVLTRADVLARKARSASVKGKRSSPWDTDEAAMFRKTAVRAAQWQMPQSAEMQRAEALARAEDGTSSLADALDPGIAELLDQNNMLPPDPDPPPPLADQKDSQDDDLTR